MCANCVIRHFTLCEKPNVVLCRIYIPVWKGGVRLHHFLFTGFLPSHQVWLIYSC